MNAEIKNLSAPDAGVTPGINKIEYEYGVLVKMEMYTAVSPCRKKDLREYVEYYKNRGRIVQPFERIITTQCKLIDLENLE